MDTNDIVNYVVNKYKKIAGMQESQNNTTDNQGRTLTKEQQEYFKGVSDLIKDKDGNIKRFYHGTQRADRVGNIFDPNKATSGPMAYFTDNKEIANNYSQDKQDTSISREYDTEKDLFKVDGKSLDDYWQSLTTKQKEEINQKGKNIGFDEDYENIIYNKKNDSFGNQYEYYLKNETNNNGINALYKLFIEDGNLFAKDMNKFVDVLNYAGVKDVTYLDPYKIDSKVYEAYLNLKNPFDTSNIDSNIINQLKEKAKKVTVGERYSADAWDKSNIEPKEWINKLEDDLENGTTHAWTVIPDWVTETLKDNRYDGIVDTGGKNGGQEHQVAIPFYSNQIKSVDNTNPTSDADIRYSQDTTTWQEYLEKNYPSNGTRTYFDDIKKDIAPVKQHNVVDKHTSNTQNLEINNDIEKGKTVNLPKPPKTPKDNGEVAKVLDEMPEREKQKDNKISTLTTKIVDKGYYVDKLARKYKNRELSSKYDYSLQSNGIANQIIGVGRYNLNTGEKIGKGLYEIFEPIENADLVKQFSDYLYHKHNIDRMSLDENYYEDNKPVFGSTVTAKESKEKVRNYEIEYPEFISWANDVYDYNNANLDMMVDYGMLSQEDKDYYNKKYPHYVPIVRDNNRVKVQYDILPGKNASVNNPIKKAKGGNENLLPLKDAMAIRTMQTVNSSLRNNFGRELYKTLYGEIEKTNDTTLDENIIDGFDEDTNIITASNKQNNATFTIYNQGEKTTMEISDEIYEALKPSEIKTFKYVNKLNNFRRGVITEYNPTFMFTNPIKDIQDGFINSKHPTKFIRNLPKAVMDVVTNGKYSQRYIANGGSWETYFNYNQGTKLDNKMKEEKLPIKIIKVVPRSISKLNEIIEMTPRMSEFISSLESGDTIETATYNAQEVTTNFKRGGDWTKTLDRNGVTFLNASMQGATKQIRNIQEGNTLRTGVGLAVKFAVVGLSAQILNNMIWGDDDDDYNNLSDYVKNNYYILGKYGDGHFIRIPRGRVTSVIQKLFDDTIKSMKGEKVNPKELFDLLANQVIPTDPTESNLLSPIADVLTNTAWYGGDLVPTRLQNYPDAEQYDESTDSISKWLGEKLGVSPYKINYLLDQYSGVIGDLILPYLTQEAESDSDTFFGKTLAPMKNKFAVDSVTNTQLVSDIYDLSDELTKKKNSKNATDEDILKFKYINNTVLGMTELYKEKRAIQQSDLKDSEKTKRVREKQKEINRNIQKALETYENVVIDGSTAYVGEQEYYLNKNNEWTKKRSR